MSQINSTLCTQENISNFMMALYLGKYSDKTTMDADKWKEYLKNLIYILKSDNTNDKNFEIKLSEDETISYSIQEGDIIKSIKKNGDQITETTTLSIENLTKKNTVDINKKMYVSIIKKCNIYEYISRETIYTLFLESNPQKSEKNCIEYFRVFFSKEEYYNDIKTFISGLKNSNISNFNTLCNESSDLINNQKKNINLSLYETLIDNEIYKQIISKIKEILPSNSEHLDLFYRGRASMMPLILLLLTSSEVLDTGDIIPKGLVINNEDRNIKFKEDPATVDPRQFLAIEKFTKFKKQGDKACFLFHGVGTGKTITSISIALSNLSNNNLYNLNGEGNDGKKPLKVLIFAPQGLFFSAFMGDAKKMSIYTYNNYFINLDHTEGDKKYSYTLEKFEAQIQNDRDSYYAISFVGFNYTNLFSEYGFKIIESTLAEEKYDVLISDEAHKILTEYIKPNSNIPFTVDRKEFSDSNVKNKRYLQTLQGTNKDSKYCLCIQDYEFYNFVKEIKQSIFLTGTPIQRSVDDIINIVRFLNIKEINSSNTENFFKDIKGVSDESPNLFFKPFSEDWKTTNSIKGIKKSIAAYTFCFSTAAQNFGNSLWISGKPDSGTTLLSDFNPFFGKKSVPKPSRNWLPLIVGSAIMIKYRDSPAVSPFLNTLKYLGENQINKNVDFIKSVPKFLNLSKTLGYYATSYYIPSWQLNLINLEVKLKGGDYKNNEIKIQNCPSQGKEPEPEPDCSNYKQQSLIFHPDRNIACIDDAKKKFQELNNKCNNEDDDEENINSYFNELNNLFEKLPEKLLTQNLSEMQSSIVSIELKKIDTKEEANIDSIKKVLIEIGIDESVIDDVTFLTINCRELVPSNFSKILENITGVMDIEKYVEENSDSYPMPISISELVKISDTDIQEIKDNTEILQKEESIGGKNKNKTKHNKTRNSKTKQYKIKQNKTRKNKVGGGDFTVLSCFESLFKCYFHNYMLQIDEQTNMLFDKFEKAFFIDSPETNEDDKLITLMRTNKEDFFKLMEQLMLYQYFNSTDSTKIDDINQSNALEGGGVLGSNISRELTFYEAFRGFLFLNNRRVINIITGTGEGSNPLKRLSDFVFYQQFKVLPKILDYTTTTIGKSFLNISSFFIGTTFGLIRNLSEIVCKINLEGIIDNLKPFISIYNYDYMDIAIEQCDFYNNILNPASNSSTIDETNKLLVDKYINTKGNTYTFPSKYIENVLLPYNYEKIQKMNQLLEDNKKLSEIFNSPLNVKLEKVKEAQDTYELNEKISNIACDVDDIIINNTTEYKEKYLAFAKGMKDFKLIYEKLKFTQIKNDIKLNIGINEISNTYTDVSASVIKIDNDDYRMVPINITSTFSYDLYPVIQDVDKIQQLTTILDGRFKEIIESKKIENFKWNQDYKSFSNILQMLKIIRCGVIRHNGQYVLHPHYVVKKKISPSAEVSSIGDNTDTNTSSTSTNDITLEYYLPLIYPPNEKIMYGFINFLNEKGYKYIWLNDTLDPEELDNQYYYGSNYTYPLDSYGTNNDINPETKLRNPISDKPICIVLSPGHKEGFSFTFNPAIFTLALCNTSGDEEQVYGRVLRKYGIGGFKGKYDKKIYQHFSGSTNTSFLQTLPVIYGNTDKVIFRGVYDNIGYNNTVSGLAPRFVRSGYSLTSILGEINYSIVKKSLSIFQSYNVQKIIFGPEAIKYGIKTFISIENTGQDVEADKTILDEETKENSSEEIYENNYSAFGIFEEAQLVLLHSVKKITLDFFNRIVKHEEMKKINKETFIKPLDLLSIIKNSENNGGKFCFDNLTSDTTIDQNRDCKLKLKNAIICMVNSQQDTLPRGGKKTIKKNKRKLNKKTRKYKK